MPSENSQPPTCHPLSSKKEVDKPRLELSLLRQAASPVLLERCCFEFLRSFLRGKSHRKDDPLLVHAREVQTKFGSEKLEEHMDAEVSKGMHELSRTILSGEYRVATVRIHPHRKKDGKHRAIMIADQIRDRIVDRAVLKVIAPHLLEKLRNGISFSGLPRIPMPRGKKREQRSTTGAFRQISSATKNGKVWLLKADISKFFDSIDRDYLLEILSEHLPDNTLDDYMRQWTNYQVSNWERIEKSYPDILPSRQTGVPQGSSLSPLMANLYLLGFDKACSIKGVVAVRYVDDLLFVCPSRRAAERLKYYIVGHCGNLGLSLKEAKSKDVVYSSKSVEFLGYEHVKGKWHVPNAKKEKWLSAVREDCGKFIGLARKFREQKNAASKEALRKLLKENAAKVRQKLLTYGSIEAPSEHQDAFDRGTAHSHHLEMKTLLAEFVRKTNGIAGVGVLKLAPLFSAKKKDGITTRIPRWPHHCIDVK